MSACELEPISCNSLSGISGPVVSGASFLFFPLTDLEDDAPDATEASDSSSSVGNPCAFLCVCDFLLPLLVES
jgi:hypothetical protein